MPPKQSKADVAKKQKVVEDKTFGLKNKNKSKQVQKYVQNLKQSVQPRPDPSKLDAKVLYICIFVNYIIIINYKFDYSLMKCGICFQLDNRKRRRRRRPRRRS